jgi:16S rRNA processing protein RimM
MRNHPPNPWRNPPVGLIAVGEILGTHGNKGEVKITALTDTSERWMELTRVFVDDEDGQCALFLEQVRFFKGLVLVKFRGIEDLTAAADLRGKFLWLPEAERPPLPPDRFYCDQIIGLRVETLTGRELGLVAQILFTGANDVYVLRGGPVGEILLPALKSVVREVNLEAGRIRVELPPGLVDEET